MMDRKNLIKYLICLIFFILIINFFANKFYWYFSIWYFDMFMHFLGGFWVALACLYLFQPKDNPINSILKILLPVLCVGIGWEVYEILVNDVIARNPFNSLDTFSDIFFDLAGGATATLYFFKRIIPEGRIGI